jgi:hypothetical protein
MNLSTYGKPCIISRSSWTYGAPLSCAKWQIPAGGGQQHCDAPDAQMHQVTGPVLVIRAPWTPCRRAHTYGRSHAITFTNPVSWDGKALHHLP